MSPYGGGGTLTEEQLEYLRQKMPDVVGISQDMERQVALADKLRQFETPRMDWASQASRAIDRSRAGYLEGQRAKQHAELRGDLKGFWGGFPGAMKPGQQFNMYGPGGGRPLTREEEFFNQMMP